MDADDHPVEVVLKESRRFIVPLYQRKYQWTDKRLLPFWEDVEAKAAEALDGDSKFSHYMGALILSPIDQGSQIGITPVVQVVDGQQRLTTFQLFLAALREVARHNELNDFVEHVDGYLFNVLKSKDTDKLTKFKLTPTPSDRELFHDILELNYVENSKKYSHLYWGVNVPKNTAFPAFRAYHLFFNWIEDFGLNGPSDEAPDDEEEQRSDSEIVENEGTDLKLFAERLEALLSAVLDRLKLVVITLGENDDAQVIFETLNSKGEPLLAMDLVRNSIFHRAEKQQAATEELYHKIWNPLDHAWWREAAPNARPRRPRIDHFLAHILAAETGGKISMRELYAEYRSFAVPKGKPRFDNVEDELMLLQDYAPIYETLEGRTNIDPTLYWLGRKLAAWQVTTVYPVAMQLGSEDVAPDVREEIAQLIYSYIVRRALCGLTTKNLNNVFQGLASVFLKKGPSVEEFQQYFCNRTSDSIRFPDNAEFTRGVLTGNAYSISLKSRLTDVLWELELASRSSLAEQSAQPEGLTVEHVLPQTWTEEWPFDEENYVGPNSEDQQSIQRVHSLNSLGNLTLITGGLNSSSRNRSFDKKKVNFSKHTGLFLNKWFIGKDKWAEHEIRERGEYLASEAIKVWKYFEIET